MPPRLLFLTLKVFSATSGIEKVCRVMGRALYEHGLETSTDVQIMSMHDDAQAAAGNKYFPAEIFFGFGSAKAKFILAAVEAGSKSSIVLLSHINLLIVAWLIKKISPGTKVILQAHGIEIWYTLPPRRTAMLKACDTIASVSRFTCEKVVSMHNIPAEKCTVLNNCIDPYLKDVKKIRPDNELRKRYGFDKDNILLFTLTRLSLRDRYKGYEHVLSAMSLLIKEEPRIRYLIAGRYEATEKSFINDKIETLGLAGKVILTGFVPDEELPAHFLAADVYVMPSIKEGFGIVFVEAMFYGLSVIAGNADGSADALLNGKLGLLIDPENPEAIAEAIRKILNESGKYKPDNALLMSHFSYEAYKRKLATVLNKLPVKPELSLY